MSCCLLGERFVTVDDIRRFFPAVPWHHLLEDLNVPLVTWQSHFMIPEIFSSYAMKAFSSRVLGKSAGFKHGLLCAPRYFCLVGLPGRGSLLTPFSWKAALDNPPSQQTSDYKHASFCVFSQEHVYWFTTSITHFRIYIPPALSLGEEAARLLTVWEKGIGRNHWQRGQ